VLRFIVALFVCIVGGVSVSASAETCPGNPDALGTSRVLTINPDEFTLLGTMQYEQTLPLKDHEVVITFDDGPLPPYTNIILDALASHCVKATYFLVGQMAHAYPSVVRRIYNEGHTIGTHSQRHPHFERLSMQRVEREVDGGINSVTAALGDAKALSPFFRIPYLGRTNAIERFLERKQLVTWSADVDTNDWWRGSSPGAIVQRTMRRLNANGRGIILMHDIHRATAMALPMLLNELKANGYNVVHVMAAGERPKSIPELMALPASDGRALPSELTNAPSSDHVSTVRQNHRIKKRRVSRYNSVHSWSEMTTGRPFWVMH
jgi:peptidoglycan/xylan/chitin deacetylase (PgdA/CDA1 family)